jgi:hypothetical protein
MWILIFVISFANLCLLVRVHPLILEEITENKGLCHFAICLLMEFISFAPKFLHYCLLLVIYKYISFGF